MSKKTDNEFVKSLEKYLKHRSLEIVFTLKDGKRVKMNGRRKLVGNKIVEYVGEESGTSIPLNEIQSADVYAL